MEDNSLVSEITDSNSNIRVNDEKNAVGRTLKKMFIYSIIFCLVVLILFIWNQWITFDLSYPIKHDIFGTYGDFVGGVLGTVISLYSVYMLVKTLQNQISTNADIIITNHETIKSNKKLITQTELQIFDNRFSMLLELYHKAIDNYGTHEDNGTSKGRACFEKRLNDFRNNGFYNNTEYKRRSIGAVSEYQKFYSKYRHDISVHFRMLYLLAKLTAEEKMEDEKYRISYAKCMRGQLSEGEMLLLRYNCYTTYGKLMGQYINQFNLLKHLPIMSLLEFNNWRRVVDNQENVNALDQAYLILKRMMTKMIDEEGWVSETIKYSSRYEMLITLSEKHDNFIVIFTKKKKKKKGGAIKRPVEENAFDEFDENELPRFLKELFIEMFIYSNFFQFNGSDHKIVISEIKENTAEKMIISIRIERKNIPLVLAQHQIAPSIEAS